MISLHSKKTIFINWEKNAEPLILPVTEDLNQPEILAKKSAVIVDAPSENNNRFLDKFAAVLFRNDVEGASIDNVVVLPKELHYIASKDVIRLNPFAGEVRTLFRFNSDHNSILVTERCNSFCVMCSQPPRDIDDSYLINDACELIKLIPRGCESLGITGGEPTLLGTGFLQIVSTAARFLPETHLHVLTNGRYFCDRSMSDSLKNISHPNLTLGIPLYSDLPESHDFVVQAKGAFEETLKGMLNLNKDNISIEIRVVVHKQTYSRLPQLARFIARNLAFVDHVAFMGLELTGFTKANLGALWIDPYDYTEELEEACRILKVSGVKAMVYNHQLCVLTPYTRNFSVQSISDWKNEYLDVCKDCELKQDCGGFFSTGLSLEKHSKHIKPFLSEERKIPFRDVTV